MHTAKKKPMHVQVTYKKLSAMSSTIILDDQNLGVDKLTPEALTRKSGVLASKRIRLYQVQAGQLKTPQNYFPSLPK